MKEQYIKQVEKELCLPRNEKKEVVRDLNEVFASQSNQATAHTYNEEDTSH